MYTLLTILLVVAGILLTSKAQNQRLTTLMVVLLMVLVVCYVRYMVNRRSEGFTSNYNFAPMGYTMSGGCSGVEAPSTDLVYPAMAPLAWDGLVLKSTPKPDVPLISDVTIFSPVGDGIRLTESLDAANFPTVDGKPDSPHHLFQIGRAHV